MLTRAFQKKLSAITLNRPTATAAFSRSLSTYYDSQSGMHVPIHNEDEVSAFAFRDGKALTLDRVQSLVQKRLKGVTLPIKPDCKVPLSLLETNRQLKLGDFLFLLPYSLLPQEMSRDLLQFEDNNITPSLSLLFEYSSENADALTRDISNFVDQSISTTILCRLDEKNGDAVEMANGVAQILDDTGGGDYLYVVMGDDSDSLAQVCEELSYLDVPGPTMKSRIIVDVAQRSNDDESEEAVEDCLMMGVNKFVVTEERLDWLGRIVQNQEKTCTFQIE